MYQGLLFSSLRLQVMYLGGQSGLPYQAKVESSKSRADLDIKFAVW